MFIRQICPIRVLKKNQKTTSLIISKKIRLNPSNPRSKKIQKTVPSNKSKKIRLNPSNPRNPRSKKIQKNPKKRCQAKNPTPLSKQIKNYFLINPKSTNLSYKNSPAEIGSYFTGFSASMQLSSTSKRISLTGCIKNGIEYLEVPHNSRGGLTT